MILPVFELDDIYRSAAPEAQGGDFFTFPRRSVVAPPVPLSAAIRCRAARSTERGDPLSRRLLMGAAIAHRFGANLRVNRRRDRSSFTVTKRRTGGAVCLPSFQSMACIISPIDAV